MVEDLIGYQGAEKGTQAKQEHLGSRKIKSSVSVEGESKMREGAKKMSREKQRKDYGGKRKAQAQRRNQGAASAKGENKMHEG